MSFVENIYIESILKEQREIFNEEHKDNIEQFRQKPRTPQETKAYFRQSEINFRKWFIENFIIPKYFA